ncbi:MAG: NADP-dependent oxidoreductase [Spongiibacteraceae bacterium]
MKKNRQWFYSKPITGKLKKENFSCREVNVPSLRQGQILVKNKLISMDPACRTYFSMQAYFPQLQLGDVMASFGIGEVIESTDFRFQVGDIIHGNLGWQDYSIIDSFSRSEFIYKCSEGYTEEDLLGVLGVTGLTAYFGVQEVGNLKAGETVIVGGATGACGSIVGQLAKISGCHVVGFGGNKNKCSWLIDVLGFDDAIDYNSSSLKQDLSEKCPNGIDFFSDGIGGAVTAATIPLMNKNARWYHYGNISNYDTLLPGTTPTTNAGLSSEIFDLCQKNNITQQFLVVFDYYWQRKSAEEQLAKYLKEGKLIAPTTILEGFENLPGALIDGTFGHNKIGKLNVRIAN